MIRKLSKIFLAILIFFVVFAFFFISSDLVIVFIFFIGFLSIAIDGFSYYKPSVAFILPWLILFIFQKLPITDYTRPIDFLTLKLISLPIIFTVIFNPLINTVSSNVTVKNFPNIHKKKFFFFFSIGVLLFLANLIYSGYLPLISSILTGKSDYLNYGIKGVNGLFYAYINAFAVLSYFLYLKKGENKFLIIVILIFLAFILCLTRQNIISLLLEILILHTFFKKPIKPRKILISVLVVLILFGIAGNLRSGDIKELMGLKKEFYWLPNSFIWVYSYGFFNILNLDNLVISKDISLLNGSSVAALLPSFLRPEFDDGFDLLEVINFTISSYINPILKDLGVKGVIFFTIIVVGFTFKSYKIAKIKNDFQSVGIFSVLFFCAFFSFFVNFWFYLPIISQIPFIMLFNKLILKKN
jgi:oligosaccharide repeat unit polymerase